MKKTIIGTFFIACIMCYSALSILPSIKNTEPATYASWSATYSSVEEMINNSDLIILGELVDSSTELRHDLVFTHEYIKVNSVLKGTILAGETIDVLKTGGTYGNISTPAINGVPLLSEILSDRIDSRNILLCLELTDPDPIYGQYYLIAGGYQGFGIVNENSGQVSTFSTEPTLLDTLSYENIYECCK